MYRGKWRFKIMRHEGKSFRSKPLQFRNLLVRIRLHRQSDCSIDDLVDNVSGISGQTEMLAFIKVQQRSTQGIVSSHDFDNVQADPPSLQAMAFGDAHVHLIWQHGTLLTEREGNNVEQRW